MILFFGDCAIKMQVLSMQYIYYDRDRKTQKTLMEDET